MTDKERRANEVATFYIEKTDHKNIPIQIHFVDNINDSWILFTTDDNVIRQFLNQDFSEYNGLTMPYDGKTYHLLIRNDYDDYECTVIHECTHAFDYEHFRIAFNNGDLYIENNNSYWGMALYSEFHARSIAHRYYIIQNVGNQTDFIKKEFSAIIERVFVLKSSLLNDEIAYQNFSYELMQYLGRLGSYGIDYNVIGGFHEELLALYNALILLDSEWSTENFSLLLKAINDFALSE